MTHTIGNIQNRKILYFDIQEHPEWSEMIPTEGWILFILANENQTDLIDQVAKTCIDNNVTYVCAAGKGGSHVDDAFDWEVISRGFNGTLAKNGVYEDVLMTTWHKNVEEGFWFASTLAYHENVHINVLVCLNLTKNTFKGQIINLVGKINSGWLPE